MQNNTISSSVCESCPTAQDLRRKKLRRIGIFALKTLAYATAAAGVTAVNCTAYIHFHTPDKVNDPSFRSTHCANGKPKMQFDTPEAANKQVVKAFFKYGEIMDSYQVGDHYYTGHNRNCPIKSINPFK